MDHNVRHLPRMSEEDSTYSSANDPLLDGTPSITDIANAEITPGRSNTRLLLYAGPALLLV